MRELSPYVPASRQVPDVVHEWGSAYADRPTSESVYREVWRILRKRKAIVIGSTLVMVGLALGVSLLMTPKYESVATIEINKDTSDLLGLDQFDKPTATEIPDSLEVAITTQTEANALQSDSLLFLVTNQLRLEKRKEFSILTHGPTDLWGLLDFDQDGEKAELKRALEEAPTRRRLIHKAFEKNLKVDPIAGTRLISVSFLSPDPVVAARVVNTLVNDFIEQRFRTRFAATAQVSDWLSKQLDGLKAEVEETQQQLNKVQDEAGILGGDETNNVVMKRLEELNTQLTAAEANRILRETIYHLTKSGDPELISLTDTSFSMDQKSSGDRTQLTLVQELRSQEAQLKAAYAQATTKFGAAYPLVAQLRNQLSDLGNSIQTEVRKMAARAENDYISAKESEDLIRSSFERQKAEAVRLNDKAVQYGVLKLEAESGRKLYDDLLTKLKVGGVVSALRSTNVIILDPARTGSRPARPKYPLNLALGLLTGLFGGIGLAFLRENMDDAVRTPKQLEHVFGRHLITIVPELRSCVDFHRRVIRKSHGRSAMVSFGASSGQMKEAYRTLRAWICAPAATSHSSKVIVVTSAVPEDGKTTTTLNAAAALAENGDNVLLIEADLRRPSLQTTLGFSVEGGLSAIARSNQSAGAGREPDSTVAFKTHPEIPTLKILSAGERMIAPGQFLTSPRFQSLIETWRNEFDYIVIDTPPLLPFIDALLVLRYADGVLFVVRAGSTTLQSCIRAYEMLERAHVRILGVVLNRARLRSPELQEYAGYSTRKYRGYYRTLLLARK